MNIEMLGKEPITPADLYAMTQESETAYRLMGALCDALGISAEPEQRQAKDVRDPFLQGETV